MKDKRRYRKGKATSGLGKEVSLDRDTYDERYDFKSQNQQETKTKYLKDKITVFNFWN